MKLKRLELFEFEDFHWLPNFIRSGITNLIKVLHKLTGTSDVLVDLILKMKHKIDFEQIVDLGSGSGGPMIDTIDKINKSKALVRPIHLLLTDKYPNKKIIKNVNDLQVPFVKYHSGSIDAMNIEQTPKGLKTMIASFHHINPSDAKQILDSAEQSKEPILIYEIAKNNIPEVVWWILLPISLLILILMSLIMTPFVRPLSVTQLLFTYFIPIIPIIYAWDGQASLMRTYTFKDLESIIEELDNNNYSWEINDAFKKSGKKAGYYVFGYPLK